jgi:hypothetical protein
MAPLNLAIRGLRRARKSKIAAEAGSMADLYHRSEVRFNLSVCEECGRRLYRESFKIVSQQLM